MSPVTGREDWANQVVVFELCVCVCSHYKFHFAMLMLKRIYGLKKIQLKQQNVGIC